MLASREEKMMTRYVLGEMEPDERVSVEDRFLADDEFFERLCAVEEKLIHSYIRGTMTEGQRKRFETALSANSSLKKNVTLANDLRHTVRHIRAAEGSVEVDSPRSRSAILFPALPIFVLQPGVARSIQQGTRLLVKRGTPEIELRLRFDDADPAKEYKALFKPAGSTRSRTIANLRVSKAKIPVRVPMRGLAADDFTLTLIESNREVEVYAFRIVLT